MKHLNFLLLVMMLGLSSLIYAQGETCATAVAVTPGIHNADGPATGGGLQLICQGLPDPGSADWYTFTPTVDGMISITHATPSSSELYLLSGTCAALFCEVFAFQTPISNFAVTAGTQYFIQWGDFQSSAAFNWTFDFVPVNAHKLTLLQDPLLGQIQAL